MSVSNRPIPASDVSWDATADVVVVGGGGAGASAAIEAAAHGAEVELVERAGGLGGATALSGGEIYLGGGTDLQRACGFDDTPEAMYRFLAAALGPGVDEARLADYCDGSREHFDWLVAQGVPFRPSFWDQPAYIPPTDDGLMWLGENSHPFHDIATPAPRGHRPRTARSGGRLLADILGQATDRAGVRVRTDVRVDRLVVDGDGAVAGIAARRYGEPLHLRARRGVVLANGGFVFDDTMLARHAPQIAGLTRLGTDGDDGQGIRMAQALGAATAHLGSVQVAIWASPALMCRSVLVNAQGQRFVNEDTYPGRIGQRALLTQGGDCFLVLDEEAFEETPDALRMGQRPDWVAETVAELEAEMGLPERALQATVETYNHHAAHGRDPLFHKRPAYLRPLRPPFAAIDLRARRGADRSGYLVFTLGGLVTTVRGEVLDVADRPVPGLYAAGRVAAGIAATGYISGTSIGDATFFGRRAGRSAARAAG